MSRSPSIRATCTAADAVAAVPPTNRRSDAQPIPSWLPQLYAQAHDRPRRRRIRRRSGAPRRPRGAQARRHPGQRPAAADRDPGVRRRDAGRGRGGARRQRGHHRQSQALRAVRADRPGGLHREDQQHRRCAALRDWRTINAQALVTGRRGAGRRRPPAGPSSGCGTCSPASSLSASNIPPTPENWRRIAHIISDAIYERLTGEKGYFDTRIVFIDETGPKERRVKRLAIMDQDGANVRYLTRGDDLVLTPRFSPSTQEITYMSYGQRRAARLSAQHRDRPARGRRQFPRHDVLAALLARRPARHHEPAAERQLQHLRDGPAVEARPHA